MQVGGCGPGRHCLRGVLLGLAKLGDRGGQGDELGNKGLGQEGVVAGQFPASAISRVVRRSWSPSRLRWGSRPYGARAARS